MKVKQFYNKNQFVIETEKEVYFQSYDSVVAKYNRDTEKLVLGSDWDYSNTTRKHLYLFIEDYVCISELYYLYQEKNKRAYIQKLIDNNIITLDNDLL